MDQTQGVSHVDIFMRKRSIQVKKSNLVGISTILQVFSEYTLLCLAISREK
ncbi:MAG: hypothetical protein KAS64_09535 [Spirochaetes bacterium]|nr:hypothetical protein [Spirochaetota bacterium]